MTNEPPERGGYTHRGTRAVQKMVEYAPSTGGLALWIQHQDVPADVDPVWIANDGTTIFYGPRFEELSLKLQMGLVAHQVLHVALRHPQRRVELEGRRGDVDPELFNICADALVNTALDHLTWLELPQGSVRLEALIASSLQERVDPERALLEWDVESLYRAIDDRPGRRGGRSNRRQSSHQGHQGQAAQRRGQQGQPSAAEAEEGVRAARARVAGSNILTDLLPAADADRPEAEAEHAREWRERMTRAHAGDEAHSLLRALLADLPRVQTPWEQYLRTRLARGLSRSPSLSWSRPARSYLANQGRVGGGLRLPWEPGFSGQKPVPRLAVLVDVSGSVDSPLVDRFAQELEAITRRLEAALVVIIGDDHVADVQHFEPGRSNLRAITFEGGGGTDFTPLLREATKHDPDLAVYLTDLAGRIEYRPPFPVIWAVPSHEAAMPHPFGEKLVLD
jgi:predicted metal-dependent peptidase